MVKMKAILLDSTNYNIKEYFIENQTLLLGLIIGIKTEPGVKNSQIKCRLFNVQFCVVQILKHLYYVNTY